MRILMITDYYLGGLETHLHLLTKLLEEKGDVVDHYSPGEPASIFARFLNIFSAWKIRKLVRESNYDAIHLHHISHIVSPLFLMMIPKNIKKLMTVHCFQYYCPKELGIYKNKICPDGLTPKCLYRRCAMSTDLKNQFLRQLKGIYLTVCITVHIKILARYIDYFICPSKSLKALITRTIKNPKGKIIYLPYFAEPNKITDIHFEKIRPRQFLYVGRLAPEKGVHIALKALKRLTKKIGLNDIRLKIAGSGRDMDGLKKMVRDLNLEGNVEFLGGVPNNRLDHLYQESMAVLIPSNWLENNPLVAYEAMRNATPIIASNVGGLPDLVDPEKNGWLFEMGDYVTLSKYMETLYNNVELRKTMGMNGLGKLSEFFNSKKYYEEYVKMIRE